MLQTQSLQGELGMVPVGKTGNNKTRRYDLQIFARGAGLVWAPAGSVAYKGNDVNTPKCFRGNEMLQLDTHAGDNRGQVW
jgi:hypothetical protein